MDKPSIAEYEKQWREMRSEMMHWANLNPAGEEIHSPLTAFGCIHKNSTLIAASHFIGRALSLLECYRHAALDSNEHPCDCAAMAKAWELREDQKLVCTQCDTSKTRET